MRREEGGTISFFRLAKKLFAGFVFSTVLVVTGYTGILRVQAAAATPPRILMYQGRLLNSNNVPVSDATASMSFALYDDVSAGTCLWSNNDASCASVVPRTVVLGAGLFSEPLGDTTAGYAAIGSTVFSDHAAVFLEVTVNGETLSPRKRMLASPFAMNADVLDGYDTTMAGATSPAVAVFDANGNLQVTGSPQGSGVAQAALVVAPNGALVAANELLLSVEVSNVGKFSVDAEGDTYLSGNLTVNGTSISSIGAMNLSSGGSAGLQLSSASGLVNVANTSDFAVGASVLSDAPFGIDVSTSTTHFGALGIDPTLSFVAGDGSTTGQFTYGSTDTLTGSGMNFALTGLGTIPSGVGGSSADLSSTSSISGTSASNLGSIFMYGTSGSIVYSGIEGSGTTAHEIDGTHGQVTVSGGTSVLTYANGIKGDLLNTSTNNALVQAGGYLAGVTGLAKHNSIAALGDMRGVYGETLAIGGTIASGYGVMGSVTTSGGTIDTGYAVYGKATSAGVTNRYGVYGEASGGTTNFAGYFTGSPVHIDADTSADVASFATGTGDLFVGGDVEVTGDTHLGDATGSDALVFTSGATTNAPALFNLDKLTLASGLVISRADGMTDFTGNLLEINQYDSGATTAGSAAQITQLGTGNAIGLHIIQSITSGHVANTTGANALVVDVNEAASSDDAIMLRSDADGTADTEFRVTTAGDAYADGAFTGAGADFAEYFATTDSTLVDMTVACTDPAKKSAVRTCGPDAQNVIGVVSTNPAFIGNIVGDGTEDLRSNSAYRLVGLTGQIDTKVSADHGAIAIGDPIAMSSTLSGYGAKALGPTRVIGFALSALSSGTGSIRVLVQPHWYAGGVLTASGGATQVSGSFAVAAATAATSTLTAVDSASLQLRGSVWNGSAAEIRGMGMKTTVSSLNDYRLSFTDSVGSEVASLSKSGDLSLAGKFYPSDRGRLQGDAYMYYDGSAGLGGGFMRTNASGWATGSYDFAEMFSSQDALVSGELVALGGSQGVTRATKSGSQALVGIVSTKPGFLAGENVPGSYPIALAGRVPTLVSTENGAIAIGDPLTISSVAGVAMKATEAGQVVGYAAEPFTGATGKIVVYVNVSYYAGAPVESGPATDNAISQLSKDIEAFNAGGTLDFSGGNLAGIASLASASGTWRLEDSGDIVTNGKLVELVTSASGENVETYAATTREKTIELSGTVTLNNGRATVRFVDVDAKFSSITDSNPSYRALVTPYGATGSLYVTNRTTDGFDIVESGTVTSGVSVDWMVIAYRRDFAPASTSIPSSQSDVSTSEASPTPDLASADPAPSDVTDPIVVEQPAADEVVSSDPLPTGDVVPSSEPAP